MVKPLSAAAGLLLALCIGIGARLETGAPPGLPPKPFAHLLGRQAPDFTLPGFGGGAVSLARAGEADAWVLYFTDAACRACKAAYPLVARAAGMLPIVAVATGDPDLLEANLGGTAAIGHDEQQTVHRLYDVRGVPSALLIDRNGVVRHAATGSRSIAEVLAAWNDSKGGGGMMDRNALKPLLAGGLLALGLIAALATGEPPEGRDPQSSLLLRVVDEGSSLLSRGTPAPDFELPDAAGKSTVSLGDLKGESAAAVFVSFSCPYSRQLMRTVLDEGLPDLDKRLLFIQRGGGTGREPTQEEADLQAELVAQFPLLEDADGSTFDAYRTSGVPTTYLLDAEAKVVASGVGEPEGAKLVRALVADALGRKG